MKNALLVFCAAIVIVWLCLYFYLPTRLPDLQPVRDDDWDAGAVVHLLPTASHERILVKASFFWPLQSPPSLLVDDRRIAGTRSDTEGRFWSFDAAGLAPATNYTLRLFSAQGLPLCDSWPLSTFPAPDQQPERFRLLIYTGLGGHDAHIEWFGSGPLPLDIRARLLRRALCFKPDALVSSGDQIYYDLQYDMSAKVMGASRRSIRYAGEFDRSIPVLGTTNEAVLKKAVDPQIAFLYGMACRSIPTFFLLDDHDYFENDFAAKKNQFNWKLLFFAWRSPLIHRGVSFPPEPFMIDLARSAQRLYLPEFLPDANRPPDLPGSGSRDRAAGVSELYGTLRFGRLFEGLLYESRRFITLDGENAQFMPRSVERWLISRMSAEETVHVVNIPAIVFGWSAGKWLEWYPDVRADNGSLTRDKPKYQWHPGWFAQHNRLLTAASSMKHAVPLFLCGDLHSLAEGRIVRSGDLDLSANPVISVATGSLGTGPRGFPSKFREKVAEPPLDLVVEERLPCVEKNGFVIADFTPDQVDIKFYAWKPPEPVEAIETLEPFHTLTLKRHAEQIAH